MKPDFFSFEANDLIVSTVHLGSCTSQEFNNVTWELLYGTRGSGLCIHNDFSSDTTSLSISNSIFKNITSWYGGALYLCEIQNITI